MFQPHPYSLVYAVATLVAGGLATVIWPHRRAAGAGWLLFHTLALTVWSAASIFMWISTSLGGQIFWNDLGDIGAFFAPASFLIFCRQITSHDRSVKFVQIVLILLPPISSLIILITNEFHHLFYGSAQLWKIQGLVELQRQPGVWYTVNTAFLIIFLLAGIIILIRSLVGRSQLHRTQVGTILAGACISVVVFLFFVIGEDTTSDLNVTLIGFIFSCLIYSYAITRQGLLELIPIARGHLIESMSDAVIVLDAQERVMDINPAAGHLLDLETNQAVGKPATEVLISLDQSSNPFWHDSEVHREIMLKQYFGRTLDINISPLTDILGRTNGKLIVFRDISVHRQNESALMDANQKLINQLNEIRLLRDQLHEQAIRDPLTNLFNRRYLEEILNQELVRAGRENYPVSLIMMDLDRFKRINDTFGHKTGDEILQGLSDLILLHIRGFDVACRYGGEEFVILMPNTTIETAFERAEYIRTQFASRDFPQLDGRQRLGISLGVAAFPMHGLRTEHLLDAADQALYTAKRTGRNRTVIKRGAL